MKNPKSPEELPNGTGDNRAIVPVWIAAVAAALILAVYGTWNLSRRAEVLKPGGVSFFFTVAPDTVPVNLPSRFEVQVRGPDGTPMPGRPVNLTVTPQGKAVIMSVSGKPVSSGTVWGRSDLSGAVSALVRADSPGEYHLAAADSGGTTAAGVSTAFQAR